MWLSGWIGRCMALLALLGLVGCSAYRGKRLKATPEIGLSVQDPAFMYAQGYLLGVSTLEGNHIESFVNGSHYFPVMLEAIESAQESVTLEMYIFRPGDIGSQFIDALIERARAGVEVCVMMDAIGSRNRKRSDLNRMREAGVKVAVFNRFSPLRPFRVGHRDHRKLLIIDGRIGFLGGAGIDDRWRGDAASKEEWRDGFYRVEGPVVAQLQSIFFETWMRAKGEVMGTQAFLPAPSSVGAAKAHAWKNSVGAGSDNVRIAFMSAFAGATQHIRIAMAYFVPDKLMRQGMIEARRRGVEVEIIIPGKRSNAKIVRPSTRAVLGGLLEAGVRVYEYQPSMYHTKFMIVDDVWVTVGSANFDSRSLRYNEEANLNVWSRRFAEEKIRIFEEDKAKSTEITLDQWKSRSFGKRFVEVLTWPIRGQL